MNWWWSKCWHDHSAREHCFSPSKSEKYNTGLLKPKYYKNKKCLISYRRTSFRFHSSIWNHCCVSVCFRWLDVSVANLTCTRYWVVYLQVIQEAVWPGGTLPTAPRLERSQQQKDRTRQQALHCLMRLLPGTWTHTQTVTMLSTKWGPTHRKTCIIFACGHFYHRFCILILILGICRPITNRKLQHKDSKDMFEVI